VRDDISKGKPTAPHYILSSNTNLTTQAERDPDEEGDFMAFEQLMAESMKKQEKKKEKEKQKDTTHPDAQPQQPHGHRHNFFGGGSGEKGSPRGSTSEAK
jgi:hypothetical protein